MFLRDAGSLLLDAGGTRTREGASVKRTRSVRSEPARAPTGGRSRCGFAKRTRGFSAQSLSPKRMQCLLGCSLPCLASKEPQTRGESNSVQGAGVKQTPRQRRVGRAFLIRMTPQAETASRNRATERDTLSQWRLKWKVRPGIDTQNGMRFPDELLAESPSQNPRSERDMLSASRPLNSKTCAPSITKLGRREPKRNRRRST